MRLLRPVTAVYLMLLAVLCACLVPPWEPPDEPSHLFYVNFVARTGQLPNQYVPGLAVGGEGHQPPLYYWIGSVLNRLTQPDSGVDINPVRNPKHVWNGGSSWYVPVYKHLPASIFPTAADRLGFYLLRFLSVGTALLNLWWMFRIFALLLPGRHSSWLAAVWVVTLPQFAFISGAINNDNLANLFSTAAMYWLLRIVDEPLERNNYVLAGLALGLGILTKKTLLFVLPVTLAIVAFVLVRRRQPARAVLKYATLLCVIAGLLSAFFFVRNYCLYGEFLGAQMEKNTLPELVQLKPLWSSYFFRAFPLGLFASFVGRFGYMNVPLPTAAYVGYALLVAVGVCGLLLALARGRLHDPKLLFAALFVLSCLAGVVVYNLTYSMPQGRFLFPVLPMIAALLARGYQEILGCLRSGRAKRAMVSLLVTSLLALDALSMLVLYRFYYLPSQYG